MTVEGKAVAVPLRLAVVNGTAQTRHLLERMEKKEAQYDFIEVMACPGGIM